MNTSGFHKLLPDGWFEYKDYDDRKQETVLELVAQVKNERAQSTRIQQNLQAAWGQILIYCNEIRKLNKAILRKNKKIARMSYKMNTMEESRDTAIDLLTDLQTENQILRDNVPGPRRTVNWYRY